MLSRLIVKGRVQEATNIVNAENVRTMPITDVQPTFIGENTRVIAQILKIKKGGCGKKKTVTREGAFGKVLKLEHPYDRLVLCRDIAECSLFYIYCKNDAKAIELFLMRDCAWTGLAICIFEPEYEFLVAGVLAISSEQPLLPLVQQDLGMTMSPYIPEWATTNEVQALFVRHADLQVQRVNLVEACGAGMCDGQHDMTERCCALSSGTPPKLIVRCIVSSTVAGVQGAKFQSTSWSRFMVDEQSMKVS